VWNSRGVRFRWLLATATENTEDRGDENSRTLFLPCFCLYISLFLVMMTIPKLFVFDSLHPITLKKRKRKKRKKALSSATT
jgi:hypothetical protein